MDSEVSCHVGDPGEPPSGRARERSLSRWLGFASAFLAVGIGYLIIYSQMPAQRLMRELARLKASGAPMTLAAAAPPSAPDARNAAIRYEKAFRLLPKKTDDEALRDFISRRASVSSRVPVAKVKRIVQHAEPAIRLIEQAAQRPACHFPVDWAAENPAEITLPHYSRMRAAARLILAKALLEARTGNGDLALRDVAVVLQMGKHIAPEPMLISQLVRIAIDAMALAVLNRAVSTAPPSAQEASHL